MKKGIYILVFLMILSSMVGCSTKENVQTTIRVASLKGPTSIGLVKLMEDNKNGESKNKYDFFMTATADEIVAKLGKGELDVAAIPANLASVLYNKMDGKISVAAINTLSVLYIVENGGNLNSLEDLKGKTIYSTGKGTTPEHVLNYVLEANGIDPEKDVNIEYKSEAAEVATLLASEEDVIALLPQPFITASQMKNDNIKIAFSMEEEWQKLNPNESQVTGVVVVTDEFLEKNQEAVSTFLEEYKKSVEFVNSNVDEAAKMVGDLDIIPEPVAVKAIPLCNVVFITGDEMEEKLGGYLAVLHGSDPKSVGGNLPDEEFYFK
ncbi:ABC transporter substrate-binding protein [Paratissierella segnis]|uniref:ABC transporter substrate-binding protein n=1 Tax=Paratissierella segnis TaxID=2763679 RepID=A0A926IK15_9FIRM|nr:ABC transporter substrate-binding protein [Paratissierella segnis]MBC8587820.1 ABC transporter substrate-binding protein [Paratissierella segnis]